ncbi:outer membrane lipoprotein carrier protein LolA [Siccirubricoccus sp. KC 17139]|uniref:Outer membrane lipoprotein carrier protein LolA n=1 Tax=Siccirubricoccus soli TaxID=2899147 RepID=A0ABT1DBP6_9PROT|nr:outer membrane lipoprotein carrier protein LolA [Siccirubricoccus soli]MCO6419362.1 outer membrane lipoprotein carrier protein LolA [Siccirubricoccus soli]MCP2685497.1 outer membrane lipoprotein carrier protein LolA [Siccirubricoccus soli]
MQRRALFALPFLLPPLTALAQQASLSDRDRADLARAEAWMNALQSLKARFLQIGQNGGSAEGTGWIVRPGRMRFEYDPPEPLLLIASHGQFFYFDKQLRQATTVPLAATPLGILLSDNLRFSGDITVTRVERASGLLGITLFRTGRAAEGRLTLIFSDQPMELKQWAVVDAQGQETRVSLYQPEYGGRFPSSLFEFNDPRFREQLGIP